MNANTDILAMRRSDAVNKGAALALFDMLAEPVARMLVGDISIEIGVLGAQEKPAP